MLLRPVLQPVLRPVLRSPFDLSATAFAVSWLFSAGEQGFHFETYDPNKLLQRRNLLVWSEDQSNAAWQKLNGTVNSNAVLAPDGTMTADTLVATASGAPSSSFQLITNSNGSTSWVIRTWVSAGTYNSAAASIYNNTAGAHCITSCSIVSGPGAVALAGAAPSYAQATGLTSEWTQLELVATGVPLGAQLYLYQYFAAISSASVVAGQSTSWWGAQANPGTVANAYQKVTDWNTEYMAAALEQIAMWQDSTGTTPVTAVEQQVGLWMDTKRGLARGQELVTNGGFDNGTTGWTPNSATLAVVGGELEVTSTGTSEIGASQPIAVTVNKSYEVTLRARAAAGNATARSARLRISTSAVGGTVPLVVDVDVNGTTKAVRGVFTASAATMYVQLNVASSAAWGAVGDKAYFDLVSVKEVPGNHATQSTGNSRPKLSALVNLLTKTEQMSDAAWSLGTTTVDAAWYTAPNGQSTAQKLTASGADSVSQAATVPSGATVRVTRRFKRDTHDWVRLTILNGANEVRGWYNLATGTAGSGSVAGTGVLASTPAMTSLGNGWYECRLEGSIPGTTSYSYIESSANGDASFTRVAGSRLVWGADLRTADDAAKSIPPYQRVNTPTDYDTAGFCHFEKYDGSDDYESAASGGGGTTGFLFCAAVCPTGGAGTARVLWADTGTNTGYRVQINASNQLQIDAGNGTAFTSAATVGTLPLNETHVVTAWDDGSTLNVQIDNGAVASVARPTVSAGSAGFTFAKSNTAAAGFFNGRYYGRTYRQSDCGAAKRAALKTYHGRLAGMTI